jgi:HSP20 family molecular chaperone IbpA
MTAMRTMGLAPVLPPEASVEQSANEYVVHLAVPGFAQGELEVEIAGRFVTVHGDQTETAIEDVPFPLARPARGAFSAPGRRRHGSRHRRLHGRRVGATRATH